MGQQISFPDLDVLAELRGIDPSSSCIEVDSMEE